MTGKRIAIVYDWLDKWGGVERVLLTLHEMFPEAHWYTSYFDRKQAPWAKKITGSFAHAQDDKIKTSFIQKLPGFIKKNRILSLPFYPYAFESFDLRDYDLVISVTSSFAKGIITKPGTKHICYLLTPTRWLWGMSQEYFNYELRITNRNSSDISFIQKIKNTLAEPWFKSLREWDYVAAQRPDKIISISNAVSKRCSKYYRRESEVIYPPFDREYWQGLKSEIRNPKYETNSKLKIRNSKEYYLVVSRLEPYKRVDLAVEFFNTRKDQLVIVGKGSQKSKLQKLAGKNIQFLENLTDLELASLYTHAQALIMPQEEDFGYAALEAQFFGCPVIAYSKGGACETVEDGVTGVFFHKQEKADLHHAFERFHTLAYNLKSNLTKEGDIFDKFSKERFKKLFLL